MSHCAHEKCPCDSSKRQPTPASKRCGLLSTVCQREREGESVCVCVSECALLLAWLGKVMSKYAGACCLFYNKAKPSTKKYTHTRNLLLNIQLHTHTHTLPLTHTDTRTHFHTYSYRVTYVCPYRIWLPDASY